MYTVKPKETFRKGTQRRRNSNIKVVHNDKQQAVITNLPISTETEEQQIQEAEKWEFSGMEKDYDGGKIFVYCHRENPNKTHKVPIEKYKEALISQSKEHIRRSLGLKPEEEIQYTTQGCFSVCCGHQAFNPITMKFYGFCKHRCLRTMFVDFSNDLDHPQHPRNWLLTLPLDVLKNEYFITDPKQFVHEMVKAESNPGQSSKEWKRLIMSHLETKECEAWCPRCRCYYEHQNRWNLGSSFGFHYCHSECEDHCRKEADYTGFLY